MERDSLFLRGGWDGKSRMGPEVLIEYRALQKAPRGSEGAGDAWSLHHQRLSPEEQKTLIWSTLPPPKGGARAGEDILLPERFVAHQQGLYPLRRTDRRFSVPRSGHLPEAQGPCSELSLD